MAVGAFPVRRDQAVRIKWVGGNGEVVHHRAAVVTCSQGVINGPGAEPAGRQVGTASVEAVGYSLT